MKRAGKKHSGYLEDPRVPCCHPAALVALPHQRDPPRTFVAFGVTLAALGLGLRFYKLCKLYMGVSEN